MDGRDIEAQLADQVKMRPLNVGILLFEDVEVLDFAGPFEVFSVAGRILQAGEGEHPPFHVHTIARTLDAVRARHGLRVLPEQFFGSHPPLDIVVIPGGVVDQPIRDEGTLAWIRSVSSLAVLTASVCTGAFLLAEAGLLTGRSATTHWEDIPDLKAMYPDITIEEDVPYVDLGDIVTSAGISAGIGMSLHLVERALGRDAALRTARQMQYDWK